MRFVLPAIFLALSAAQAADTAPLTPEARGLAFVQENCARCHAIGPRDESPYPPAPPLRTLNAKYDVEGLAEAFAEGIQVGHQGVQEMPAFELSPPEIDDLLAYLRWIGG